MLKSQQALWRCSSKFAVACPGQGFIKAGLLAPYAKYRDSFEESLAIIDESLNEKISVKLFDTSTDFAEKWMIKTSNAQPAILSTTYIIHEILKKNFGVNLAGNSSYLLGHSLGEYTALLLAGATDLATAVSLVRKRGVLMERLFTTGDFGMVAVMFRPSSLDTILEHAKPFLANINSFQQIVLSGKISEINDTIEKINTDKKHILKSVRLPVQIPFHNALLGPIEEELTKSIGRVSQLSQPVISNLTGQPVKDPFIETISANSKPVQWIKSIQYLESRGVPLIVNLGPGNVLQSINSKFKIKNVSIDSVESMQAFKDVKQQ